MRTCRVKSTLPFPFASGPMSEGTSLEKPSHVNRIAGLQVDGPVGAAGEGRPVLEQAVVQVGAALLLGGDDLRHVILHDDVQVGLRLVLVALGDVDALVVQDVDAQVRAREGIRCGPGLLRDRPCSGTRRWKAAGRAS